MKKRWLSRLSLLTALCLTLVTLCGGASAANRLSPFGSPFAPAAEAASPAQPEAQTEAAPAPAAETVPAETQTAAPVSEALPALPPSLPDALDGTSAESAVIDVAAGAEAVLPAADTVEAALPETSELTAPAEADGLMQVGGSFSAALTEAKPTARVRLQVEQAATLVLTAEGMPVSLMVTNEFSGLSQLFTPERASGAEGENAWQPLMAAFAAQPGSYLITVEPAEAGLTGIVTVWASAVAEAAAASAEEVAAVEAEAAPEAVEAAVEVPAEPAVEEPAAPVEEAPAPISVEAEAVTEVSIEIGGVTGETAAEVGSSQPAEVAAEPAIVEAEDAPAEPVEEAAEEEAPATAIDIEILPEEEAEAVEAAPAEDPAAEAEPAESPEVESAEASAQPEPAVDGVRPGPQDAVIGSDDTPISRGSPVVLASATTVACGAPVTFTVSGLMASTYHFYLFSVPVGGSAATQFNTQNGSSFTFTSATPSDNRDIYCVVNCLTNTGWQQLVSGWVHVRASAAITVTADRTSVEEGKQVTFKVHQHAGAPAFYYYYIIMNPANSQLYSFPSTSDTFTYTAPAGQTNIICLAYAYNGSFTSAFSPWVAVTPSTALKVACSVNVTSVTAGSPVTVKVTKISGAHPITGCYFMLYDGSNILMPTGLLTVPPYTHTFTVPNMNGTLWGYVLATDGSTWASAISAPFTVTAAASLTFSVIPSALTVRAGETMWFSVTPLTGGPILLYDYTITDGVNPPIHVTSTSSFITYTPPAGVTNVICTVQCYDGTWAGPVSSPWVSVVSPTYRALIIGQSYSGTSMQLQGPPNDSNGMAAMLGTMSATPYTVTRRTNLTRNGILNAISSTFAGAGNGDVSLLYYAGHAVTSTAALIGSDLLTLTPYQLRQALDQIPGKKIVIFDACYSGATIGRGVTDGDILVESAESSGEEDGSALASQMASAFMGAFRGANTSLNGAQSRSTTDLADAGYYVLCSAHSTQESWESGGYGWFTQTLTLASGYNEKTGATLALAADSNGDKFISLSEAFSYLQHHYDGYTLDAFGKPVYFNTQCYPAGSSQKLYGRN